MPVPKKLIQMSEQARAMETRILDCGGRRLASVEGPNNSALDFYSLNGRVMIVQDFNPGAELYIAATTSAKMKDVYAEIEKIAAEKVSA
jgi:hypothetical protein